MAPDNTSDQFEWVSAKATCTAAVMFERLRAGVKQDVERRNALVGLDAGCRFEFTEEGEAVPSRYNAEQARSGARARTGDLGVRTAEDLVRPIEF